MELMSIGKFAKKIGVNVATLRRMEKKGELMPTHVSSGGTRYYSTEQLKHFIKGENKNKLVVGYCRVSTRSQKDDLETQVNNVELIEYLCEINNVELEVVDHTDKSKEEELTDDLIQIITVFANRLYGQRSKKTKRLIEEVRNSDNSNKD